MSPVLLKYENQKIYWIFVLHALPMNTIKVCTCIYEQLLHSVQRAHVPECCRSQKAALA